MTQKEDAIIRAVPSAQIMSLNMATTFRDPLLRDSVDMRIPGTSVSMVKRLIF